MIQLFLVLCGSRLVRERCWMLFALGALWMFIGGFLFLDALDGSLVFPITYYTIPLAFDGAWAFASFPSRLGGGRAMCLMKGTACLLVILLIFFAPVRHSGMVIGILAGLFLCPDALWRGASAWVVRYDGWQCGLLLAASEFLFGIWSFVPWPTAWEGQAGIDVGTLLLISACTVCVQALRISRLPPGVSVLSALHRGEKALLVDLDDGEPGTRETAIVHVWTPTGSMVPVNRGVSRYVAAVDRNGVVSTGHAALELAPDVYVSHYPAVEIDRSGTEFAGILRAVPDNNVPGLFQPNYARESADWCPSTVRVPLPGLNGRGVRRFQQEYCADTTYNLTGRNCASAVAKALDAGLDGLFADKTRSPLFLLHLLLSPELRVAGFLRHRAAAMAWTPGIVLDYARALRHLVIALGGAPREPGVENAPATTTEREDVSEQRPRAADAENIRATTTEREGRP
ncbi:MAG: hypothetical protein LBC14_08610 [Desulfovibrio sp.]|jgi:hypothetical protein|nr:hypothetical protein [Desulfovibrio sp.]